jgi:hypothetical protein
MLSKRQLQQRLESGEILPEADTRRWWRALTSAAGPASKTRHLRVAFILGGCLLVWPSVVLANLGETFSQIVARYGQPVRRVPDYTEGRLPGITINVYLYQFNGQKLLVEFAGGKCKSEMIWAPASKPNFSEKECLEMIKRISGQKEWTKEDVRDSYGTVTSWTAANARAGWERFPDFGLPDSLIVCTVDYGLPPVRTSPNQPKASPDITARVLKWQQELADKGDPFGEYMMGSRYRDGNGVPSDLDKAREFLKKSADQGYADAVAALAKLPPSPATGNKIANIMIHSADFGMGRNVTDVTARVVDLLRTRAEGFTADAKTMGSDPLPGKKKRLIIRYDFKGTNAVIVVPGAGEVTYQDLVRKALK